MHTWHPASWPPILFSDAISSAHFSIASALSEAIAEDVASFAASAFKFVKTFEHAKSHQTAFVLISSVCKLSCQIIRTPSTTTTRRAAQSVREPAPANLRFAYSVLSVPVK
jgi:hypothetical protein